EDATASGTKDVPRHIENAESRGVQKSRNYILLIELVLGGKGEGVNAAKLAVGSVLDEVFDRAHRLRLRRLSQSSEEAFGFSGNFHVVIGINHRSGYHVTGRREHKSQISQPFPSPMSVPSPRCPSDSSRTNRLGTESDRGNDCEQDGNQKDDELGELKWRLGLRRRHCSQRG